MDKFVDERDYKLLDQDRYTFFVLRRILGGPCKLILSDHERVIICFSKEPFPVWIWTPDDAADKDMAAAYDVISENGLLDGNHNYNIKYKLADYFINRAKEEGKELSIRQNMYAYDCPKSVEPQEKASGELHKCTQDDFEELVDLIDGFHNAVGIDIMDRAAYEQNAKKFIEDRRTFFWQDKGITTACCKYVPNGDMAGINLVYTKPECRRKHYAENLVYTVTELARAEGYLPMLYTDADYVASNACYEKIGYIRRGELCTVG